MSVKIQDAKKGRQRPQACGATRQVKQEKRSYSRFRQTPLLAAESLGANSPICCAAEILRHFFKILFAAGNSISVPASGPEE